METALSVASFTLVQEVLKSLEPEFKVTQPKRSNTLDNALGLLATNEPAPSDEEIEQWLDEYHIEKWGS